LQHPRHSSYPLERKSSSGFLSDSLPPRRRTAKLKPAIKLFAPKQPGSRADGVIKYPTRQLLLDSMAASRSIVSEFMQQATGSQVILKVFSDIIRQSA
jgi:hypothetical protein